MRQAKKLKRLKSILVSKTYYIFFLLTLTYLLTYLLVMTANAVDLLSKPREKRKNQNFLLMRWVRTQPHGTLRSLGCLSAN